MPKLIIPDRDFSFAAQTFTLTIQHTADGARLSREQEQARLDRQIADEHELALPLDLGTPSPSSS